MFLYCFEIALNPVVDGLQVTSDTAGSNGLVADVPLPAAFSYIRQEDNI